MPWIPTHPGRLSFTALLPALALAVTLRPAGTDEVHAPQGVRLLENKSYDDSEESRKKILELFQDLRVTEGLGC